MELAELKQRRREFLEDTWKYYADDVSKRAIEGKKLNKCRYKTSDGKRCAIGRHIIDQRYKPYIEDRAIRDLKFAGMLPKDVLDLGMEFLVKIQLLHDCDDNWNDNGLSVHGNVVVAQIEKEFCL